MITLVLQPVVTCFLPFHLIAPLSCYRHLAECVGIGGIGVMVLLGRFLRINSVGLFEMTQDAAQR